jgi:diacylglycerol O-acyltransferase
MDASFLYFEKKEAPLHIGGIHVFDGEIPFETFREMVDAKLPLLPRYRQKVIPAPLNLGHPTWEFDPNFDIKRHIFQVNVDAPGTITQLRELAEKLLAGMLDRSKPLWEIYIVEGLEGGNSALISKVHHAMVDGISGVDLMKIMFDMSPNPAPLPKIDKTSPPAPRSADFTRNLIDGLIGSAEETMRSWTEFQKSLVNLTENLIKETPQNIAKSSRTVLPSVATPVSLMPFNRQNTGKQKLAWAEYSFAEARAIRANIGGTVNDVVLTVLSGAIIRYLELHGEKTAGRAVRVMVPVSMRREDQRGALGNMVSVLPVEIPLDLKNPLERYRYLTEKTGTLKGSRVAEGVNIFSALMGTIPASMQALVGSFASTPVPAFNIVCTNVPGPQIPLYVLGKRMTASYPYVPTAFSVGVSCGFMSYDQRLFFGIAAEASGMPDSEKFKEFLDQSFAELREAAGVVVSSPPVVEPKTGRSKARTRKPKERPLTE